LLFFMFVMLIYFNFGRPMAYRPTK